MVDENLEPVVGRDADRFDERVVDGAAECGESLGPARSVSIRTKGMGVSWEP